MQFLAPNMIALVIVGLSLAVIGAIIILLLIGIRADRKERDSMPDDELSEDRGQYLSDDTLKRIIADMGMCNCGHDVPVHSFYGETRSECHGDDGECDCTHYEVRPIDAVSAYPSKLAANADYGPPMIPVRMSPDEIDVIISTLNGINGDRVYSLVIAYDPIDRAIKFKMNGGRWSPPFGEPEIDMLD